VAPIVRVATKAERVQAAVKNEIARMAGLIDSMPGLRGVSFNVKIKPDGTVRAVIVTTESENECLPGQV
jgi:hypothetical protein